MAIQLAEVITEELKMLERGRASWKNMPWAMLLRVRITKARTRPQTRRPMFQFARSSRRIGHASLERRA
eukprot:11348475-Prorocentrum_lima.AAC.1